MHQKYIFPVIVELILFGYGRISRVWSMNALLLSDGYFVEFISEKKNHFFETNTTKEISAPILWETLKVCLCG